MSANGKMLIFRAAKLKGFTVFNDTFSLHLVILPFSCCSQYVTERSFLNMMFAAGAKLSRTQYKPLYFANHGQNSIATIKSVIPNIWNQHFKVVRL